MVAYEEAAIVRTYCRDASNYPGGWAEAVWIPENVEELIEAVRQCVHQKQPFTIAAGRTGLTAAAVPEGGVLISVERLRRFSVGENSDGAWVSTEPGVVLQTLQAAVEERGWFYPPDPTERSSLIGGNIATNASGARTFRYGATRPYVQRLRVLFGDGEIADLRRGAVREHEGMLRITAESGREYELPIPAIPMPKVSKHAAGLYLQPGMDAVDLFIGSEGILGVILEADLRLIPLPEKVFGLVVFFDDEENALEFVEEVRRRSLRHRQGAVGEIDARLVEFFDRPSLQLVRSQFPEFPEDAAVAVWIEQECTEATESALLEQWYTLILRYTSLADATWLGSDPKQQHRMQQLRHAVPEAVYERICALKQTKIGTDMAVPERYTRQLYQFYQQLFREHQLEYVIYGHIGNAHLHANIFAASEEERQRAQAAYERAIAQVLQWEGTISAEHGVGKLKKRYLQQMFGTEVLEHFRRIKRILDPDWLINRGTMIDD